MRSLDSVLQDLPASSPGIGRSLEVVRGPFVGLAPGFPLAPDFPLDLTGDDDSDVDYLAQLASTRSAASFAPPGREGLGRAGGAVPISDDEGGHEIRVARATLWMWSRVVGVWP